MPVFPYLGTFNYRDQVQEITHSAGDLAINVSLGSFVVLTLEANIGTLSFTNWAPSSTVGSCTIRFIQGNAGGYTVGWDAAILWAGGSAPTITATLGAEDVITFNTTDSGTSVYGFTAGQDFS